MRCPKCDSEGIGAPIPKENQHYYGGETHFSRFIGVEYGYGHPDHYDGVSEWNCPDCGCRWGRFSGRILADGQFESKQAFFPSRMVR